MLNLLNEVSSFLVGIISIVFLLVIVIITIITNLKLKKFTIISNSIFFLIAFLIAIFLCKPILSLFDKMFSFSTIFFNIFMLQLGQIDSLNVKVTMLNYTTAVNNFRDASVGISDTLKSFLLKVFENTTPPSDNPTTLGAIGAMSISYMFAIFIVALILFVVSFALIKVFIKFISKKIKTKSKNSSAKVLGGLIGTLKGIIICLLVLVSFSTLPVFGISTDYLANGFESTKIMSPVYNFVVNTEQNLYESSIDFNDVSKKIYQSKEGLDYAIYQNDISGAEHRVNVELLSNSAVVNLLNLNTLENENYICDYIYTNNTLYLYNEAKLKFVMQYSEKDKTIKYKTLSFNKNVIYTLSKL